MANFHCNQQTSLLLDIRRLIDADFSHHNSFQFGIDCYVDIGNGRQA